VTGKSVISAKAGAPETRSDAIVVSFDYNWYERLCRREFSVVIRKRVPITFQPAWIYFHMNSPKSSICARASLKGVGQLDLGSATDLQKSVTLSKVEIQKYFGQSDSVGAYFIQRIELARIECSIAHLQQLLVYNPPQSFFRLSKQAKIIVDQACDFETCVPRHKSERQV
jgi:hypothetical protein